MTAADRRLGALLAAFAPSRARELASRLGAPSAAELARHAERLAAAARRERLAAIAAALAPERPPRRIAIAEGPPPGDAERPRIAALVRGAARSAGAPPAAVAPALRRLLRDRSGS